MARTGGGGEVLVKKNSKLEVFLKKALSENVFERIRGYESCIVVSEHENKAFKYVVLGDEWIYLTENPAKTIQQAVWLGDIVSVDLVNDYPEFLSGDERENSQHLAIRFLTSSRGKTARKSRKVHNGSIPDVDRSASTTPMGSYLDDFGYLTQSMSSLHGVPGGSRPNSQGSLTSAKDKSLLAKKKKTVTVHHDKVIGEERLEDIEEYDVFNRSVTSEQIKSISQNSPRDVTAMNNKKFVKNPLTANGNSKSLSRLKTATGKPKKPVSLLNDHDVTADGTSCCFRFSRSRPKSSSSAAFMSNGSISHIKRNSIAPAAAGDLCFEEVGKDGYANRDDVSEIIEAPNIRKVSLASMQRPPTATSGRDLLSARLTMTPLASSRNSTPYSQLLISRNTTPYREYEGKSLLMMPSGSDLGSLNGDVTGVEGRRLVILNIYLLNLTSPMLMLIRSAWSNFLIRATLLLDSDFEKNTKSGAVRSSYNQVEKMDVLFVQLKRELFMPHNTLEDVYNLSNELRIAAERNFALKKIFWKNSDMFPFFVRHIQAYLPTSASTHGKHGSSNQRQDEIELVILLTEIISMMFRETELIPARFQTLKSQRGKGVLDLLRVLTCTPEIQDKGTPPSGRAAQLLRSFQEEGYSSSRETEVSLLLSEYTDVTMTAVFELFLMARQANWSHSADNFLNISWMVQILEELSTTEKFVERVIKQMMRLISPARVEQLSPSEAVKLYRQFSVILTFLSYSPRVTFFIRNNYMEEFKYFVQPAVVERKLPVNYPITRNSIQLIESVLSRVLDVPCVSLTKSPR